MNLRRELREWFGLTLADFVVTLSALAVVAMFFVSDPVLDGVLATMAVLLAVVACPFGMKPVPELSRLSNAIKLVSYPGYVVLVLGAIAFHYAWFNA